jgi:hypothetical protein
VEPHAYALRLDGQGFDHVIDDRVEQLVADIDSHVGADRATRKVARAPGAVLDDGEGALELVG